MLEQNAADIIQEVIDRQKRPFMTVKTLWVELGTRLRRQLGIENCIKNSEIRDVLIPLVGDRLIFHRKGALMYILVPCDPEDLVRAELSQDTPKGLKGISSVLPFSKADVSKILNHLLETGEAKLLVNDTLDARIVLTGKKSPAKEPRSYTREEFLGTLRELDMGRIFVRICDLRKKLGWPREVFDDMLKTLRDDETIQMHIADDTAMTQAERQDSFTDENNYRMGTVTLNAR